MGCGPFHSVLGQGLPGQALGADLRMESEASLRDARVGRAGPLHSGINDLSLNFLITKGETCPFKVTDRPDYPEKMRSNSRRALKKVYT